MERVLVLLLTIAAFPTSRGVLCPTLGDFPSTGTFEGWPEPSCPGDPGLELSFRMYTLSNPNNGEYFDRDVIPAVYDPARQTAFLVHGWTSNANSSYLHTLKNAFLVNMTMDMNIVIVGWGGRNGSEDLNYFRSSSDTRTVGAHAAEVMIDLVEAGGHQDRMQLIGHSLGGHVVGHFGRWATNKGFSPGRVTGLDPAGPFFTNNTNTDVGLYEDSGQFVDVIHTDHGMGCTPEPGDRGNIRYQGLGHVDFYPNDGHDQPGCDTDSCSHGRSTKLYESTIVRGNCIATDICTTAEDLPTSCTPCSTCGQMGHYNSGTPLGIFRLNTTEGLDGNFCSP